MLNNWDMVTTWDLVQQKISQLSFSKTHLSWQITQFTKFSHQICQILSKLKIPQIYQNLKFNFILECHKYMVRIFWAHFDLCFEKINF